MNLFDSHNSSHLGKDEGMHENDTPIAFLKIAAAWLFAAMAEACTFVFGLSLSQWVQVAALLFTVAQLYFLLRDKWWRDPKRTRSTRRLQYDRSKADKPRT